MSKQPGTGTQEPLKRKEHSLTARHKCAPQGTAIDPEKTVSDDHRGDHRQEGGGNQRDSVQKEQVPDHEHRGSRTRARSCSS